MSRPVPPIRELPVCPPPQSSPMGGDRHGRMKRAAPGSVRTVPPVGWRPGLGKRGHLASSRQEGGLSANGRPFREVSGLTGRTFRAFSGLTVRQPTKRDEKAARKCLLSADALAGSNPAPATTSRLSPSGRPEEAVSRRSACNEIAHLNYVSSNVSRWGHQLHVSSTLNWFFRVRIKTELIVRTARALPKIGSARYLSPARAG